MVPGAGRSSRGLGLSRPNFRTHDPKSLILCHSSLGTGVRKAGAVTQAELLDEPIGAARTAGECRFLEPMHGFPAFADKTLSIPVLLWGGLTSFR